MDALPGIEWPSLLPEQLDWHWRANLRPRMDGLTDEEYLWEPVPGMWSIRPRPDGAGGGGGFTVDYEFPAPDPPPVTTIAWRIIHLVIAVFGLRAAAHFGGPPVDYATYDYPGDAATALARLDAAHELWHDGVRSLTEQDLRRPIGPGEGPFAEHPMAALILHINREAIHHGAEIALLRDLYRRPAPWLR
jgi:hypothetical protein